MNTAIKLPLIWLSLLIVTLYLPLAGMVYLPGWYTLNCNWHSRCERIGEKLTKDSADNITAFFLHREPLNTNWSKRERFHLSEVRAIYDFCAGAFLVATLFLFALHEREALYRAALINSVFILGLLLVTPVFGYFWRNIFHAVMFDNDLWKTTPRDITWYLTPRVMFRNSFVVMVLSAALLNLLVLAALKREKQH